MNIHPHSRKFTFLACIALILASIACNINFEDEADTDLLVQQTLVAIQQTQNASDSQPSQEEEIPEIVVVPTMTPTLEQPDVVYEGISFSYDPAIALNVLSSTVPAQNMGAESMPGDTYPTHFVFNFNAYPVGDHFHEPEITVYPANDYYAMSEYAGNIIDNLKQTLISQPGGGPISNLPFLPMWNAAQIFSAKVTYFDFTGGSGVRFLTMYGQATYPVDNTNMFYTYQGLTDDGAYYLSAILPVTHPGLPNEGQIDDYWEFEQNWDTYISDTIAWLEAQDPQSFTPSLELLDAMMASFEINR